MGPAHLTETQRNPSKTRVQIIQGELSEKLKKEVNDVFVSGDDAFKQRGGDDGREAVHSQVSSLIRRETQEQSWT